MPNLLVDERDQKFVLHEMLRVEELCELSLYGHLSKDEIDASLEAALKLAVKESYPIMAEADREGCVLENGNVKVPQCYHRLKDHYDRGRWPAAHIPRENGGLGFPMSTWAALFEGFTHNLGFTWNWSSPFTGSGVIVQFGSTPSITRRSACKDPTSRRLRILTRNECRSLPTRLSDGFSSG